MLKHNEGDCADGELLLIPNIFVGRDHNFETDGFGNVNQLTV